MYCGCHQKHQNSWFDKNGELLFSIASGIFLAIGFAFSYFTNSTTLIRVLLIISLFFGGYFMLIETFEKLKKGKFEIDSLMLISALGAIYLNHWIEAAVLLFLFSLGHALEHYSLRKAQKSINNLSSIRPDKAILKQGDEQTQEVDVKKLNLGDVILVKPHAQIAADGVIIKGTSTVNQSSITGESMPLEKMAIIDYKNEKFDKIKDEHRVFAGTLNGSSPLEIRVLRLSEQSTISRIIKLVSEAQSKQSPTQRFTERIEKYYVPSVLIFILALCFVWVLGIETFDKSLYRAMNVLVAASPCALAISTPSAVLSGIARAAQKGVLIKGGGALEDLGSVNAIAFDKTRTLTEGKPSVVSVITNETTNKLDLLKLALSIERFSNHPLAVGIVNYAQELVEHNKSEDIKVQVVEGKGIEATIDNDKVKIGKMSYLNVSINNMFSKNIDTLNHSGHTLVGVEKNNILLGIFALTDKPKKDAKSMISSMRKLGIKKIVMLTGDQQPVANNVGIQLGIKSVYGDLLPKDKMEAIEKLNYKYNKTAMVGDGVNDAPAMATATVSIAMGAAGSDVALETADIALLSDKLKLMPFAIGLSRKARGVIKQNLIISLSTILFLVPLALFGLGIAPTVFLHEGTTILVVLNALRLLYYKK